MVVVGIRCFGKLLPGYVAVGVLAFLMAWDEFLYALIFTTSKTSKTLTVAVSEFGTKYGIDYGMMMTAGLLATVVPMVLALISKDILQED